MQYLLSIYFNNYPVCVSSRLTAHHQEDQLCTDSNWYNHVLVEWLLAGSGWNSTEFILLMMSSKTAGNM